MKRNPFLLSLLLLLLWCVTAPAQQYGVELTPFGGFQFGGRFYDYYTGEKYELDESYSYGLMVDVDLDWDNQVEFYISRQPTKMITTSGYRPTTDLFDVDMTYIHVGATQIFDDDVVRPYAVGTLGITIVDPDVIGIGSKTRFSMAGGGGVKLMATDNIGFRLDGRAFATFVTSGGGIACGSGCSVFFSGDVFWQFQASAGVVIRF